MKFEVPALVLARAEQAMASIPNERLFNDSTYTKLRESWCAGLLGVGLAKLQLSCLVAVNEGNRRMDVDFYLRTDDWEYEFQLVEVQEPERTRGLEYKRFAQGTILSLPYEPERGRREGPAWIRTVIEKKVAKNYERSVGLNLLVYANFSAGQLQYDAIVRECDHLVATFESIWIISSIHMCSIGSANTLPLTGGWVSVRSIEDYYV